MTMVLIIGCSNQSLFFRRMSAKTVASSTSPLIYPQSPQAVERVRRAPPSDLEYLTPSD